MHFSCKSSMNIECIGISALYALTLVRCLRIDRITAGRYIKDVIERIKIRIRRVGKKQQTSPVQSNLSTILQ